MTTQSLESGSSLKLHALLCRPYVKGRDWYDFVWYVARGTRPDSDLLRHAALQQGPWAGQQIAVPRSWVQENLKVAIGRIDWAAARDDVLRFLPPGRAGGSGGVERVPSAPAAWLLVVGDATLEDVRPWSQGEGSLGGAALQQSRAAETQTSYP